METIQSRDNSRIKEYGKLAVSRKYRDEEGLFVLEGEKLFGEALRSGVEVEAVFVTAPFRAAHPELEGVLSGLTAFEVSSGLLGVVFPVIFQWERENWEISGNFAGCAGFV